MRKQFVRETIEMLFLPIKVSLLGTYHIWGRYRCESSESRGYYGMANTYKRTRST
jgi:hypothetical protein